MDPLKRSMDMRMLRVKGRIARWMERLSSPASALPRRRASGTAIAMCLQRPPRVCEKWGPGQRVRAKTSRCCLGNQRTFMHFNLHRIFFSESGFLGYTLRDSHRQAIAPLASEGNDPRHHFRAGTHIGLHAGCISARCDTACRFGVDLQMGT
jgi:hypothetical protein